MTSFGENTQLTTVENFDASRIVFSQPTENNITIGEGKRIKFYRIMVGYRNEDNSVGELVLGTDRLFSYGIQENKNDRGLIDGYSMALCMWNRDGATPEQEAWLDMFNSAIDTCKQHVLTVKDEIEKYDLDEAELKRFNPLYYKKDKGVPVPGKGPTLYPKLMVSKKEQPPKILTPFADDATGEDIDARDLINKYCYCTGAIRIESIFAGAKVSPQVKLHEAMTKLANTKARRLLRPKVETTVREIEKGAIASALGADNESQGSLDGDSSESEADEEEVAEPVAAAPKTKKIIRKVVKKKRVPK